MKQVYFAALAGNLGMLSVGQFYGWPSPMLPKLKNNVDAEYPVHLTNDEASWIASLFMLGAPVGAIICALIVNFVGRKNTILFAAAPSLTGWLMIFATSPWELYISRFISGIGVGLAYTSTPIYLGEISPPKIRGTLTTMMGFAVNVGIIIQYAIGPFLSVQNLAFVSLAAPCMFVITFMWVSESPYYLIRKNAQQKAIDSLVKLRGTRDVYKEVESIEQSVKSDLGNESSFRDLLKPNNRRIITVMTCLSIFQQAVGVLPIVSYSQTIFDKARTNLEGKYWTIILGAVQMMSTIICLFVTDRFGRKSLMIISYVGAACTIGLVATYFTLQYYHVDTSEFALLPAVGVLLYKVMCSLGLTSLMPTLSGEVFPINVKAFGGMMVLLTTTLTGFVMTKLHASLDDSVGLHVPMWMYCMCGFLGALCTYFYLPETKGKTLEEIQKKFAKSLAK